MNVALVCRGDAHEVADLQRVADRFGGLIDALSEAGHHVQPVLYDEGRGKGVLADLLEVDVALVWVNPIDAGRDRSHLDQLLRQVASAGITVSTHPDVVLALGTKRVLYDTRHVGWGTDTRLYETVEELQSGLAATLRTGPRVLKQHRGSSGNGVWSVELIEPGRLQVRHAQRGSEDEQVGVDEFCTHSAPYFDSGPIIDQQFQSRLAEGMVRCYLVRGRVEGFGLQETNALIPADPGTSPPTPTQRHYHPPTKPELQQLKQQLESDWVPAAQQIFDLQTNELPLLWDCDFLLGPKDESGADTYVLCEINVSSVHPYPASVVPAIVDALGT